MKTANQKIKELFENLDEVVSVKASSLEQLFDTEVMHIGEIEITLFNEFSGSNVKLSKNSEKFEKFKEEEKQ